MLVRWSHYDRVTPSYVDVEAEGLADLFIDNIWDNLVDLGQLCV
jgi:hypothetical protein